MAFDLFRYVKNGDLVAEEGTDKEYEVGGKFRNMKILLIPAGKDRTRVTDQQRYVSKNDFNENFYYHRDNLTEWATFGTKQITKRLKCL